jgi:hypothetical protein
MTSLTKQLHDISLDLFQIETAFISLMEAPKPAQNKFVGVPLDELCPGLKKISSSSPHRTSDGRLPHLPRCCQITNNGKRKDLPCIKPASYPHGLCASHYRILYGHEFTDYKGKRGEYSHFSRCLRCDKVRYENSNELRVELCPSKEALINDSPATTRSL